MRLAFFGSGGFGLPTLAALVAAGHDLAAVVTQPDRPAGRGGHCRATPIKEYAASQSLPIFQPEHPNTPEFAAVLAEAKVDLAVIVAYGHLIKNLLLGIPRLGFVNLHASLLPAYRGAAPVPWAILAGETVSGVTLFSLNEVFDAGGILVKAELPISADDTSESYLEKLAPIAADLLMRALPDIEIGRMVPQKQDPALATRAPKLTKADGMVDWQKPLAVIGNQVRALQPWPLAHCDLPTPKGLMRINILELEPAPGCDEKYSPGDIIAADPEKGLVIMTGDCPVRLICFQPEGKRPMSDIAFLRGKKVLH